MQDYLTTGERRKEAGSRKGKEEEEGKGRKWRNTWLQGEAEGSRKQGEVRGGGNERKEVQDYLGTGGKKQKAERGGEGSAGLPGHLDRKQEAGRAKRRRK